MARKQIANSNCNGTVRTTPRKTMAAFDQLPPAARRSVANASFNWATQPILEGHEKGTRRFGSARRIVTSIRQMDAGKIKDEGVILMEYAVIGERHDGEVLTIQGGFENASRAEQHPIRLADWKRVWVAPVGAPIAAIRVPESIIPAAPCLPPKPWDWVASGTPTANGSFQAYLVDATGRKIAAIWGKGSEKELIADHILARCNEPAG